MEIVKNKELYYYSTVGKSYCYLTDRGKEEVTKWMDLMAWEMIELEKQELDARAKKLMWEELKK
jgi:DNA-binding PadR family transcriptional regulator